MGSSGERSVGPMRCRKVAWTRGKWYATDPGDKSPMVSSRFAAEDVAAATGGANPARLYSWQQSEHPGETTAGPLTGLSFFSSEP